MIRKTLALITSVFIAAPAFSQYQILPIKVQKIFIPVNDSAIHKVPLYNGKAFTLSYDSSTKFLTIWFHCNLDNVCVAIIKNGEKITSDVFDMEEGEALEYNLSECCEGEYIVYVTTENMIQYMKNFYLVE